MFGRTVSAIVITMLLTSTLTLAFNIQPVKPELSLLTVPDESAAMQGTIDLASQEPPPTEWSRTYGGTKDDWAYALVQTTDGGYALAGGTMSFGAGSYDFWLAKTDTTGNMQWNMTYGGSNNEDACALVQTVDGGYALAGRTASFGAGNMDFWLVKTAPEQFAEDIALLSFSPVQVVYDATALVANKPTVFRAVIQNTFTIRQLFRMTFSYNDNPATSYQLSIAGKSTMELFIPFGSSILPQKGTLTYSAEIDPDHKIPETDETNNKITDSKKVVDVKKPSILYVRMNVDDESPLPMDALKEDRKKGDTIMKTTFPVTDIRSDFDSTPFIIDWDSNPEFAEQLPQSFG